MSNEDDHSFASADECEPLRDGTVLPPLRPAYIWRATARLLRRLGIENTWVTSIIVRDVEFLALRNLVEQNDGHVLLRRVTDDIRLPNGTAIRERAERLAMFAWLNRKPQSVPTGELMIATQPHGEIFPWPKGAVLTAVDELVLGLPMALIDTNRPMSEFIVAPNDMQINIPPEGDTFFVHLMPGMSISLTKTVQSYVVSEDKEPRRIKIQQPLV